ncbi:MAG: PEP-CTERM sorting domain-containing protein [Rhizobacter sp.]|nr:PEP-CTERM sorting domain-containing protein [Rhizobacter sp.]
MKKNLLAFTAMAALSLASPFAQAALTSCDDPLTSGLGERFCYEKFDNLTPGTYQVSFDYQAEKFAGNFDKTLYTGFLFDSRGGDATRGLLSDSSTTAGWTHYSFMTEAAGDTGLLFALRGVPGSNFGMSIQNVQVSPVPEPATYAMLLAGLGAIGFVGRRRKMK